MAKSQLDAATLELSKCRAAHASALQAVAKSERTFDDVGDAASAKALRAARDAEADAQLFVARAERLFQAAEAEQAARERVELEREAAELTRELASDPDGASLDDAITAATLAVVDALAARRTHNLGRYERRRRLTELQAQLAEDRELAKAASMELTRLYTAGLQGVEPSWAAVAPRLLAATTTFEASDPRRRYLHTLAGLVLS
jgi:hypothetical protein